MRNIEKYLPAIGQPSDFRMSDSFSSYMGSVSKLKSKVKSQSKYSHVSADRFFSNLKSLNIQLAEERRRKRKEVLKPLKNAPKIQKPTTKKTMEIGEV